MQDRGLRPEKRLGQNFLINVGVVEAIVDAGGEGATAIDVGSGPGTMALPLSHRYPRVIAVEIDPGLVAVLEDTLGHRENVDIVSADATEIDWARTVASLGAATPIVWFGNLPYYAASPILTRILQSEMNWVRAIFMLQNEVADRITASPGEKAYGILSLVVAYYADSRMLRKVKPGSFYPAPDVVSAVVCLTPRADRPEVAFEDFVRVVRAGFGQRRKTLRNALVGSVELGLDRDAVDGALATAEIDPGVRAETLALDQFVDLTRAVAGYFSKS